MGLYHDFWLLRESEHSYTDYHLFLSRSDAPARLHDDLLRYFVDTFSWVPTLNPAKKEMPTGYGLNLYGPTIINRSGGALFHEICAAWAQLFACGPEQLKLRGPFSREWPSDESERRLSADQLDDENLEIEIDLGHYQTLEVDRDQLIQILTTLARFGEQTSTDGFFILHLGI